MILQYYFGCSIDITGIGNKGVRKKHHFLYAELP